MEASVGRLLTTLYSLLIRGITLAIEYNESNSSFPMTDSHMEQYAIKWLIYSLIWGFGGSLNNEKRVALGTLIGNNIYSIQ